ncbi:MAG: hypothetical protein ABL949_03830 [Fimbriimonadaceae bacterium]
MPLERQRQAGGSGDNAAAAVAVGGAAVIIGVITLISGAIGLAVGYGIMNSKKWGFIAGAALYGFNALMSVVQVIQGQTMNLIGIAISGALLFYCVQRLTGKLGEKPL